MEKEQNAEQADQMNLLKQEMASSNNPKHTSPVMLHEWILIDLADSA